MANYRDCVNHYLNVTSDGGIASYLEPADKQFLLIKEEAIKEIINSAKNGLISFGWLFKPYF